jgi:hypothetical protein
MRRVKGVKIKFSFWAHGILAIAAFAIFLYVVTSLIGRSDIGIPLFLISVFIVITYILLHFLKYL